MPFQILCSSHIFATIFFGNSSEKTRATADLAKSNIEQAQVGGSFSMKTIFRSIGLGVLAAGILAAGSTAAFAQAGCDNPEEIEALDKKIRENYQKGATLKVAIESGKTFLEKYGACEAPKEFADWVKAQMPKWEERQRKIDEGVATGALFTKFDGGIAASKYDDVYAAGKELVAKEPDNVHVMIPMGLIGLTESFKQNFKYNDDALRYAKLAIDKLNSGAGKPKMTKEGTPVLNKDGKPAYSTWDFSKEEAIDELTYAIAYINFYAKKDKKTALPIYYQLSQSNGKYKNEPRVYATIGGYYLEEAGKLGDEIAKMIEKQKTLATDDEKVKYDGDIKAKVGLFNGYTERAIDAFARAHKVAPSATAAEKTYKDTLFKQVQELYKRRFDKEANLNEYVAATLAKPFPNPMSEVTPINDPDPAVTTNTTGVGAANGSGTGAANGNGVGAANGSGAGMAGRGNTTSATTRPAAPAPKKP